MFGHQRASRLALAVVFMAGSAVVGLVAAQPALAAPACPTGTYATASAAVDVGAFVCMGYDGVAKGGITKGGLYVKTIPGLSNQMAPKLTQLGSTMSAAGGSGTPPVNGANLAGVNGNPNNPVPGKLSLGTRALQNGVAIIGAGALGYSLGQQAAQVACSFGADVLCMPTTNPNVPPNADAAVSIDPGWTSQTGVATNKVNQPGFSARWSVGWTSTPPAKGAKPTWNDLRGRLNWQYTWVAGPSLNGGVGQVAQVNVICVNQVNSYGPNGMSIDTTSSPIAYASGNLVQGQPYNAMPQYGNYTDPLCASQGGIQGVYFLPPKDQGNAATDSTGTPFAWWAEGSQYRPPVQSSNPNRKLRTINTCEKPDGTTSTTAAESRTFTETDATFPEIPAAAPCPPGSVLAGTKVIETGDGVGDKDVVNVPIPQKIKDNQKAFPECLGGDCRLTLVKIGPDGTDVGDCFSKLGRCAGWFADPQKTSNYKCTYGLASNPKDVSLAECNVYAPTFDRVNDPTKSPYGDPDTGSEPGAGTGNGAGSGDPSPGAGGGLGDGLDCFLNGFTFNPVSWVITPFKCLFIPDPDLVVSQMQATWNVVQTRPPASVIVPMVSFVRGFGGTVLGGCSGAIADFGNKLIVPCVPPAQIKPYVDSFKVVMSVILFGVTAFALWRMLEVSMS